MEIGGRTLEEAVKETVFTRLPTDSGGLIAVDASGNFSMQFNTVGMFRGRCTSDGKCSVGIWEEEVDL